MTGDAIGPARLEVLFPKTRYAGRVAALPVRQENVPVAATPELGSEPGMSALRSRHEMEL